METWILYIHGHIESWKHDFGAITEAQVIFLDPFIVCPSYKHKFVVSPFVDEETHGNYSFAND